MVAVQDRPLFSETQRFEQFWLWLLLGIALFAVFSAAIQDGFKPNTLPPLIGVVLIVVLMRISQLQVELLPDVIAVRFFPYHLKQRTFRLSEISSAEAVTYRPIREFGGWGLRRNWHGEKIYNTFGNRAVKIHFKNRKPLWLGSQHADELAAQINQHLSAT